MSGVAVLTGRPTSFKFHEKRLDLSVPAKIGRANKDDKSTPENGLFDCKVLSKPHALLMFQTGQFFLVDTGSSNGTFVNNIRLSKAGTESELTEVFTGDILRFGSDVLDKSRNVTQRSVVLRLVLYTEDGEEYQTRSSTSRLYRPMDNVEDIQTVTKNLQESLSREHMLEEKLSQIVALLQRYQEKAGPGSANSINTIQAEISKIFVSCGTNQDDRKKFESIRNEKALLRKENRDLEERLREKEVHNTNLQHKAVEDAKSISSLGTIIQKLRQDIQSLEGVVKNVKETQCKIESDYEAKMVCERRVYEAELERLWQKDKDLEGEKMRLEERIVYLMQYEPETSRSSALSTPTTIRQLGESTTASGLSTPTSGLFPTQEMDDYHEYLEEDLSYDKLKEKAEALDSVRFELEVTKRERDLFKDENEKIRMEVSENFATVKKNEEIHMKLQTSMEEVQYLLRTVSEKDSLHRKAD